MSPTTGDAGKLGVLRTRYTKLGLLPDVVGLSMSRAIIASVWERAETLKRAALKINQLELGGRRTRRFIALYVRTLASTAALPAAQSMRGTAAAWHQTATCLRMRRGENLRSVGIGKGTHLPFGCDVRRLGRRRGVR